MSSFREALFGLGSVSVFGEDPVSFWLSGIHPCSGSCSSSRSSPRVSSRSWLGLSSILGTCSVMSLSVTGVPSPCSLSDETELPLLSSQRNVFCVCAHFCCSIGVLDEAIVSISEPMTALAMDWLSPKPMESAVTPLNRGGCVWSSVSSGSLSRQL